MSESWNKPPPIVTPDPDDRLIISTYRNPALGTPFEMMDLREIIRQEIKRAFEVEVK